MSESSRRAFTLPEVLIAFTIVVVGLVSLVSMYYTSSIAVSQARNSMLAVKHANTILEKIKGMNLATIRSHRNNNSYWEAIPDLTLNQESINVTNINTTDTEWNNNPLELLVEVSWNDKGGLKNITLMSKFAE